MKINHKILLGCLVGLLGGGTLARGESIWDRRHPEHAFLFFDAQARRVGDLITVVVSESTDVGSRENRGLQKSTSTKGLFNFQSEAGGGFGSQGANAALDLGATSGRNFDGGSTYRSEQAFVDRVTATVMDVLPNGNMVISGTRRVRVAGEERTLVMSGIVRPVDLASDNTVPSRFVAELKLHYEAGGSSQKFSRQGWLGRAANVLWPF